MFARRFLICSLFFGWFQILGLSANVDFVSWSSFVPNSPDMTTKIWSDQGVNYRVFWNPNFACYQLYWSNPVYSGTRVLPVCDESIFNDLSDEIRFTTFINDVEYGIVLKKISYRGKLLCYVVGSAFALCFLVALKF